MRRLWLGDMVRRDMRHLSLISEDLYTNNGDLW